MSLYLLDLTDSQLQEKHQALLRQSWDMVRRSDSPNFDSAAERETYLLLVGSLVDLNREWDRRLMEAFA